MKLDRLLAIVILLINRRRVQAKELAEMFEVSVRTIYRDIDAINQAGIPIVTYQGVNGGIGISEGYRLDKNLLTNNELAMIVTALKGTSTTYRDMNHQILVEKINSIIPANDLDEFNVKTQQLFIDLSEWGHNHVLDEKLNLLKSAIEQSQLVSFQYYAANGLITDRVVEPHTLVLKRHNWYVYAYCKNREDFRFFKLLRIKHLCIHNENFTRKDVVLDELPWVQEWYQLERTTCLLMRFNRQMRQQVEEWFNIEEIEEDDQGRLLVEARFPEDNWLYGFILRFGDQVEVLKPEHIRDKIRSMAKSIHAIYEKYY